MFLVFVDIAALDMRCYHNLANTSKESKKLKYLKLIVERTDIARLLEDRRSNLNLFNFQCMYN